jgi:hypothetical protein
MNDLYQVKSPAEPHSEWDLYKPINEFRLPIYISRWRTASASYCRRCSSMSCHRLHHPLHRGLLRDVPASVFSSPQARGES